MARKILQVFNRYLERGGEEIWVEEFERLASERQEVSTLYFDSADWREGSPVDRLKQVFLTWNNPRSRQKLRKEVQLRGAESLLFHNVVPVGSFGLYREAAELSIPVLQYTHNFRPFSPSGTMWVDGQVVDDALRGSMRREIVSGAWGGSRLKTALMAFYMKRFMSSGLMDHVTHWLAISQFMRKTFIEAGIPADRITTLRHCRQLLGNMPDTSDRGFYLFLGRLVPEKGCYTLLEAWGLLEKELGQNCPKLVIAGTGPSEAELQRLAEGFHKIEFVGFVSGKEKRDLLAECRALIAPSIWQEPLGLIAHDGFEFGKPVLAASSGGLVEMIEESTGGLLHRPGVAASLFDDILRVELSSSTDRQEMGMSGRQWLEESESPASWQDKLEHVMKNLS